MKKILNNEQTRILFYILAGILVLMVVIMPAKFYNPYNLQSIAVQLPELGIIALGAMVVIITGGIDLSIVSTSALSGITVALILSQGSKWEIFAGSTLMLTVFAIAVALAVAILCGLLNGIIISYVRVHSVLTTLGTMTLFNGISLMLTKGGEVSGFTLEYSWIGNGQVWFIPVPILIFIILAVVTSILMRKTVWGRSLYMFGSSPVATLFSGVNTAKINLKAYLFSSLMAAAAAIIMTSRYNSATSDMGAPYLLQSIAIVILGGINISGGKGRVSGVVFAVVILQIVKTAYNILGMNPYINDVTSGAILIIVLLLNGFAAEKMKRKAIKLRQEQREVTG